MSGVLGLSNAPRQHRRWVPTVSRVTVNEHALSWITHQSQALPRENRHLPDCLLNLWRCQVPDNFPALDLKNLRDTLNGLHLLHLHNLSLSLHLGIRARNV